MGIAPTSPFHRSTHCPSRSQLEMAALKPCAWHSGGFNIGALINEWGFGVYNTIVIIKSPQNSIGNYLGRYSRASKARGFGLYRVYAFQSLRLALLRNLSSQGLTGA